MSENGHQKTRSLIQTNEYQSVIDGTWSANWKAAQIRPKHLIVDGGPGWVKCTCGFTSPDVAEWSRHSLEK